MKRVYLLIPIVLLLALTATSALAQGGGDRDGDGVPDRSDKCPDIFGVPENGGCPLFVIATPPSQTDTDGDGLPDSDDQCPTVAGPRENRGCPTDSAPNDPPPPPPADTDGDGIPDTDDNCVDVAGSVDNGGCPPFTPPVLPTDACYVTPNGDFAVNVRNAPDPSADPIGHLLAGHVYESQGFVMVGPEIWYVMTDYENSVGDVGNAASSVLLSSNCAPIDSTPFSGPTDLAAPEPNVQVFIPSIDQFACTISTAFNWVFAFNYPPGATIPEGAHPIAILNGDFETAGDVNNWSTQLQTFNDESIEYMIYPGWAELYRTGGTCGSIGEFPFRTVVLLPMPDPNGAAGDTVPVDTFSLNFEKIQFDHNLDGSLSFDFGDLNPDDLPPTNSNDDGTTTVEYCIYLESEAGVFDQEVCYEIEIPENCTLTTSEAGVYTVVCEGDGTVEINPDLGELPSTVLTIPENPTEPVLVGLLLPAVQAAREAAR